MSHGCFTIPARLARAATVSQSSEEARKRVLQAYRDWYRAGPEIVSIYALSESPQYVRHQIRNRFERNRHVTDTRAIDQLLHKDRQDYQETMNLWKLKDQLMGILLEEPKLPEREQRSFLQKFYEGRDENAVSPAASGVY